MFKKINILFLNANSIFDFTSGSAISIRLILEEFANMGHKVFVVNSCISDSEYGYKKSLLLWNQFSNKEVNKNNFINRFVFRKMNISLIKTRNWARNLLNADEEENIFREAMKGIVPEEIFNRKDKIGFETPEDKILKNLLIYCVIISFRRPPLSLQSSDGTEVLPRGNCNPCL